MKLVKMKSRELLDLGIVLIVATILSILSISIHTLGRLYSFVSAYTDLPLAEFLINVSFLSLAGLLWITYIRWRKAAKRQAELENIISSINPDVLLVVDSDRTMIECNNSLKRMFGYEVNEVINHKTDFLYFEWLSNQANQDDWHEIYEKLERDGFHIGSAIGKKKDGETIPLEIITGNLSDRGGAVQLLRDVTERKRTEEKVKKQDEFLSIVIESLTHPFYVIDVNDYTIKMANLAAYPDSLPEETTCYALTHKRSKPCGGAEHICPLEEVKKTKKPVIVEHIHYDRDDNVRNVEVHGHPIFDDEGNVVQMIEYCLDITERRGTEEEKDKILQDLGERIKELNCLYEIAKIVEIPDISLGEIFQKTVDLIPPGWQYPDITCAGIAVEGQEFKTRNYKATRWKQSAPIKVHGKKVGVVEVCYLEERREIDEGPFLKEERNLIDAIATRLGETIERKRAEEALQRKTHQQEQLLKAARHLTASLDVKEVLTGIGVGAKEILKAHGCSIYLLEADGKTLRPVVALEPPNNEKILATPLNIETSFTGQAIKARRGLIFNNAGTDPSGQQIPGTPKEENEHVIAAPFIVDDKVLGAMCLNRMGTPFSDEDLALAETFATYAATALKNAQTHRDLQHEVVERKRAEVKIRQVAEEWEATFNSVADLVSIHDKDFRIVRVNKAFADACEMKPEEIVGKTCYTLFHGTKEPPPRCPHKQTLESKKPITAEFFEPQLRIHREMSTSPIFNEKGELSHIVHIVKDITERKRAEEALRESESEYRTLVENIPQKIFLKNKSSVYISCNANYAGDLKIKPDEIAGKTDYDFYPRDLAEKYRGDDKRIMESETTEDIEERYIQDGREVWVHTVKTPVKDKNGKVIGILGIFWDITERRRAEEALQRSEKKYRKLVETAQEGIAITDENENFTFVNQAFADLLGYKREELSGINLSQLTDEEQCEALRKETVKRMQGRSSTYEARLYTKAGEPKYFSVSAAPLFEDNGIFVGSLGLLADITERRRAEEALRKAKEEAEEGNRLKSQFVANMSHEIRTPMNAIIGMTGITLDTDLTDEQRGYLNIVRESGYALLGLIDDILDLSKIEMDKIELETIDFDLQTIIEGVSDTLAHRASIKGLELACMIHQGVPTLLRGDPGRLRQILMNLGGNAVKFTDKGEVVICAGLSEETEDQATLLFSVTDTGAGIPKKKQNKIFESFIQADGSATRKYGGAGLGLSISKRLVELMGGQIGLESQRGKGNRFWFTVTFEKQKEFKETSLTLPPDIRGMRMLVVDDNETNRTVLVKMLESFGCCGEAVESGTKALQVLKRATHKEKLFDLVLLDSHMPKMDGDQTLRAIKDDPEIKDVVVVMLTSVGMRGDAARLEDLGCAGYLLKPVRQSQLFDTIITVLRPQEEGAEERLGSIVTRHTIAEQKGRRVRILLAEDNPMNQKFAITLLRRAGYSVDAVVNGRIAIEALKRKDYDLILMDIQMPQMDGFEATRAIRKREGEGRHTTIIAMTAHAMKGDRERCLQAGMDDYIAKPVDPQNLFDTIEKWTKSRSHPAKGGIPSTFQPLPPQGKRDIPIDLETALNRFGGDTHFFKEMLDEFLNYVPKQLKKLAQAIKKGDERVVEKEAHSIKGAAGNLSAKRIADLALQLELLGRTSDLTGAKEIVCNLKTEFEHLEEYINKYMQMEGALKS